MLNIAPYINSNLLVGSDAFYSASKIEDILEGKSIFGNPYFKDIFDPTYPPVYFISNVVLSIFIKLDTTLLLILISSIFSILFLLSFFFFVRLAFKSNLIALLSVIFASVWDKVLFPAMGPKNISIIFLSFFFYSLLIRNNKTKYVMASLLFIATLFTHYVYAAVEIVVATLFFLFNKIGNFNQIDSKIPQRIERKSLKIFMIILFILFLVIVLFNLNLSNFFGGSWYQTLMNNYPEVPLSFFNRTSLISVFVLFFFPLSLYLYLKNNKIENKSKILILAILVLLLDSFFYYSGIFFFHTSVISEIAFLFGMIPLFVYLVTSFFSQNKKLGVCAIIMLLLIIWYGMSIPLEYNLTYSKNIKNLISSYNDEFKLIKDNTENNSVVLINSCDYVNRYLPYYTKRFIFSGEYTGKGNCSKKILTVCGSDRLNIYECDLRINLSNQFFDNPSDESIKDLSNHFEVNYILVDKKDPNLQIFKGLKLLKEVNSTKEYVLYRYYPT